MARCPNCSYKLRVWNVKAECPACSANIPNFNWEARLDADAVRSEKAFNMLRERKENFKYTVCGDRLLTARFILTFLPLCLLVLPLFGAYVNLPFIVSEKSVSILNMILWLIKNPYDMSSLFALSGAAVMGTAIKLFISSVAAFLLAFAAALANFFILAASTPSLGSRANIVCNILSIVFSLVSLFTLIFAISSVSSSGVNFISDAAPGAALIAAVPVYAANLILDIAAERRLCGRRRDFNKKRLENSLD